MKALMQTLRLHRKDIQRESDFEKCTIIFMKNEKRKTTEEIE